jgi:hypothetical protein
MDLCSFVWWAFVISLAAAGFNLACAWFTYRLTKRIKP